MRPTSMSGNHGGGNDHCYNEEHAKGPTPTTPTTRLLHQYPGTAVQGVVCHGVGDGHGTSGQHHNGTTMAMPMFNVNTDR
jgi:hypothetical protein